MLDRCSKRGNTVERINSSTAQDSHETVMLNKGSTVGQLQVELFQGRFFNHRRKEEGCGDGEDRICDRID